MIRISFIPQKTQKYMYKVIKFNLQIIKGV